MNGWLWLALAVVVIVPVTLLVDRVAVRIALWNEDRIMAKMMSDEAVRVYVEQQLERRSR